MTGPGLLALPQYRANDLAGRTTYSLQDVAAECPDPHRLEGILRELLAQRCLDLQLERLPRNLLRALMSLAAQGFDLALHAGDLGLLSRTFALRGSSTSPLI